MNNQAQSAERTPLEDRLIDLIKTQGPITVADYMADALGHPHEGYYMTRAAIGAEGDFITAPEISQIFGELIGLWLVEAWRGMGSPTRFNLVELGPGRGVLMADLLRAARLRPDFTRGAQVWLLETSGRLRLEQQKRLKTSEIKPIWADSLSDIAPAPSLIIANEFFDCLPIHQFQFHDGTWRERMVGLREDERGLAFELSKESVEIDAGAASAAPSEGDIVEVSYAAQDFMADLSTALLDHGGHALIFDYGHRASGLGETFQAVRSHQFWPPLAAPGYADLTAHVDFESLAHAAIGHGAAVQGPIAQGRFLERLGLALRVEMLCKGKPEEQAETIRSGAHRIAAPEEMGEIFKTLCVSAPGLPTPPGFEWL
ncbi:MAG: SAM-dependent methyltransferase [Pseudomonadota bacterium]